MRKPWQIWILFVLCFAGVAATMMWLTHKTIQLDSMREKDRQETEIARQEAELQERISSALYRMDLRLLPLITRETTRPDEFYRPAEFAASTNQQQSAELVLLNFEISSSELSTPLGNGSQLPPDLLQRLADAKRHFKFQSLVTQCPPPEPSILLASRSSAESSIANIIGNQYFNPTNHRGRQANNATEIASTLNVQANNPVAQSKIQRQRSRGADRGYSEFDRRAQTTQSQIAIQREISRTNAINSNGYSNVLQNGIRPQPNNLQPQGNQNQLNLSPAVSNFQVMRPLWVDDQLILARPSNTAEKTTIQCCWLDWQAIKKTLGTEVKDLLPDVGFQPVFEDSEIDFATALTTLPVQLVVDSPKLLSTLALESESSQPATSGLRLSLIVAWICLLLSAVASAVLLRGVMRLSERRASFVSAVTHELRTPLTTFRMYAEMLAEKMVPEGQQQEYANTLRVQADRLSHLVENVLQFASLERGARPDNDQEISIGDLFERFNSRLIERVETEQMNLEIALDDEARRRRISTQPATIEQVLFNLVDNACKYAHPSTENRIEITTRVVAGNLQFRVRDFGPGIQAKDKKRMFQPFHKSDMDAANSAPGVGLGLALCVRMARSLGGRLFHENVDDGAVFVLEIPV